LAAALGLAGDRLQRSPYVTKEGLRPEQPVPFSHQHHVAGVGLDCRYCHTSVETSSFAGIPPTKTCMNCHSQIWTNAAMLEPVRASFRDNKSLVWQRVHDLPDFVYFSHEIHVNKGVGCKSCHGPVDEMPLMYQNASLQMEWCLECHRDTAKVLRPREEVFNMQYKEPSRGNAVTFKGVEYFDQMKLGAAIQKDYHIRNKLELTSCETCHR
ncbi:MAG: cytochrome c3 family protein, partial [Terriglobales bacterium]